MLGCRWIQALKAARRAALPGMLLLIGARGFSQAAQSSPKSQHQVRRTAPASSPLQQAEDLLQQGRLDEAKNLVDQQLALNPSSVDAYNMLGIIFTAEKDYASALDAFQHALTLAPNSATTHNNVGNLYVAEQKLDLAEKEFKKVLALAPDNRNANYNLALLLIQKEQPVPAILHLQRVHPATVEIQLNLVRAYLLAGKNVDALNTARTLSAAHKTDVKLHFTLGVLLA